MANPTIFRAQKTKITIAPPAGSTLVFTAFELQCFADSMKFGPEEDQEEMTFCNPSGSAWYAELNVKQSFDSDGWETMMRPLVNEELAFVCDPDGSGTPSVANPHIAGVFRLDPFPFIDAQASKKGGITTFPVRLEAVGSWTKDDGGGPVELL